MVTKVWDDPAVFSIQVDLPQNPLRYLNVYVIMTPEQNLLIDTGFNRMECREALWNGIRELNLDLGKTSVFLTHLHSDHTGLAWEFVEQGCPIYMGQIDYQYLDEMKIGDRLAALEDLFQMEGFPEKEMSLQGEGNQGRKYGVNRMFPANLVGDGTILTLGNLKIQCIHTPGHTPGHMVLYLPKEHLLFSGDHILFDITPNITVLDEMSDPLKEYLDSLEKIRALPVNATFPAHRDGRLGIHQRIDALQEHHQKRLEEIFQAVKTHPGATAYQLAGMITWSARGLSWEQFPPHQKWFSVGETLAHLYYLAEKKQIIRGSKGPIVHYVPNMPFLSAHN